MGQCHGTCRYAIRCRNMVRDGEATCHLHRNQDVSWSTDNPVTPPSQNGKHDPTTTTG